MTKNGGQGDFSLIDLFRAEIETHTPVLSEGLLALEKDPSQTKRFEALMRAAHSIKGAARIVGVDAAVQVAHVMEDCFVAAQEGRLTFQSDSIDVLLRGVDILARIAQEDSPDAWKAANEASYTQLVADLTALRAGDLHPRAKPEPKSVTQRVQVSGEGPTRSILPPGDLIGATVEELRLVLLDLLGKGVLHIRFDLTRVGDMDPAGLAVLVLFARITSRQGAPATLEVANASPDLVTLFRMTRLDGSYRLADKGSA